MEQKRFLTAGEVFQLFGVDAEALEALVDSGDVTPLADLGTFKYRSEDFANLVKAGKLTARTSGEMFQVDSSGDIPFVKEHTEDRGLKFDENVSFLELDEDALNEQAAGERGDSKTPEASDDWFDDVFGDGTESKASAGATQEENTSDELPIHEAEPASHDEVTEYELPTGVAANAAQESDSNVRIFDEDGGIDFDEPNVMPTPSDSDVRLEGPVSSAPPKMRMDSASDSDVRLVSDNASDLDSDSDVTIAWAPSGSAEAKGPESDSDVQLAGEHALSADQGQIPIGGESDSDVILAGVELDDAASDAELKASDSDSDVRLADSAQLTAPKIKSAVPISDSDVRLADLATDDVASRAVGAAHDSGIRLGDDEPAIDLGSDRTDSEIAIAPDSGISSESVVEDSGMTLHMEPGEIDSGISLDAGGTDSGISIQPASDESRIAAESLHADSGLALEKVKTDSDIALDLDAGDSHISFGADSGLALDSGDSGIMLEQGDSGLSLDRGDSGISLGGADSGLSLEDDSIDTGATLAEAATVNFESDDSGQTQTLSFSSQDELETGLEDSNQTLEMAFEDDEDSAAEVAATVVKKGPAKGSKAPTLSETFELDESVEVEDLDISEDLDEAGEADYESEEFAEAEEEVLEASDDDFSAGEISAAEEDEAESDEYTPAAKVRSGPKEPSWGIVAVGSVACASLVMAATVMVLWGGIATMWTGKEAPGPAGVLISTLAGMSPF